jgi:large subunit ribosomal protein L23
MADILLTPHLTEKSVSAAKKGQYTFLVHTPATKPQIARAVKILYDVHPVNVTVVKNARKHKGLGRTMRKRAARSKAMVTVKKGESIADFVIEEKGRP